MSLSQLMSLMNTMQTRMLGEAERGLILTLLNTLEDRKRHVVATDLMTKAAASPAPGQYTALRSAGVQAFGERGIPATQSLLVYTHPNQAISVATDLITFAQSADVSERESLIRTMDIIPSLETAVMDGHAIQAAGALITNYETNHD